MNEKNSPGVSVPAMTRKPPYQSAPMSPTAPMTSISGSASLVRPLVLQGQAQEPVVDLVEALLLEPLAAEGLDDLGAGEGLLEHDVQLGDLLLGALVDRVELPADRADGDPGGGEDGDGDQGEHPLAEEHHDEEGHDGARPGAPP